MASEGGVDHALSRVIEAAVGDLAERLDVDPSAITVVSAESRTWPDRSMGCPQPGMAHPQVQVDGALVELQVGGKLYRYHSGGGRAPFLCESPS